MIIIKYYSPKLSPYILYRPTVPNFTFPLFIVFIYILFISSVCLFCVGFVLFCYIFFIDASLYFCPLRWCNTKFPSCGTNKGMSYPIIITKKAIKNEPASALRWCVVPV